MGNLPSEGVHIVLGRVSWDSRTKINVRSDPGETTNLLTPAKLYIMQLQFHESIIRHYHGICIPAYLVPTFSFKFICHLETKQVTTKLYAW